MANSEFCTDCKTPVKIGPRCYACSKKGNRNPNFKGGAYVTKRGYMKIKFATHPRADSTGYVYEHIVVMENELERNLKRGEVIHHIDGDKLNNDIENLQLFKSHNEHLSVGHAKRKTGILLECPTCGKTFYKQAAKIRKYNFCSTPCRRPSLWIGANI